MKTYVVGGCVRDVLLNRQPKDIDFVVVGSTPEEMLAAGFKQVGADFPVFLNEYGEEYALARTERKTTAGYHGFEVKYDPTVTIEDDLLRRDLTINAMAVASEDWPRFIATRDRSLLIDPYGGCTDLDAQVLRHVSEAFAEDPLRVLRVARFAARYEFTVASETMELMRQLTEKGEIATLTPERVWLEFMKGFEGESPYSFLSTLNQCGALGVILPEIYREYGPLEHEAIFLSVNNVKLFELGLKSMITVLLFSLATEQIELVLNRLKAPNDFKRFALKVAKVRDFLDATVFEPEVIIQLLDTLGVYKQQDDLVEVIKLYFLVPLCSDCIEMRLVRTLHYIARETSRITFASLPVELQQTLEGKQIGDEIFRRRVELVKERYQFP